MKDRLSGLLGAPVFLDSDDLTDLRELLRIVARSDVFLLLQTSNVLTRAWCLLEIYTAILNGTPIVTVDVPPRDSDPQELSSGAKKYFSMVMGSPNCGRAGQRHGGLRLLV